MAFSRQSCRICLSDTEFNISLNSNYSWQTNMVEKILICLNIVIDKTDFLCNICYKCADNIERYYEFILLVKKSQSRLDSEICNERSRNIETLSISSRRHDTSYVREVFDSNYTFSFLEIPENEEKKECKTSSPFFSYFSNVSVKRSPSKPAWKTPRPRNENATKLDKRKRAPSEPGRRHSRDLFDSQSQEMEEPEPSSSDRTLAPDDNIMKRLREKFFGRCDY